MKSKFKITIEVFDESNELVIETFNDVADLIKWNEKHKVGVDRVSINGKRLMRWGELYDYF